MLTFPDINTAILTLMDAFIDDLQSTLHQAIKNKQSLSIHGGDSKKFLIPHLSTDANTLPISLVEHQGIVSYEPTELVITVKSGTSLKQLITILDEHHQHLSFDPPLFSHESTVGGMIACGISGTSRPWKGLIRDHLLGCKILNGQGEIMQFGGQVFKNVAGFDLFRPQAGAWGTLGILLEVSLRVNPKPKQISYFSLVCSPIQALELMQQWQQKAHPITGLCWYDGKLFCRLAGFQSAIEHALSQLHALKETPESESFWQQLNAYQLPFMCPKGRITGSVYKLYTQITTPLISNTTPLLIDWGGALRWYDKGAFSSVRDNWHHYCAHYEKWSHSEKLKGIEYSPINPTVQRLQQRIRQSFDPQHLFNPHLFNIS